MLYELPDYFNLQSNIREFNLDNALALAKISQYAYETPQEIEDIAQSFWGFNQVRFLQNLAHDTELYILSNQQQVVIAFRGSESAIEDWNTNLSIKLKDIPAFKSKVHAGFYDALESVWAPLVRTLLEFGTQGQKIWLTGHSLGGALATIATAKLATSGIKTQGLYTFGQPRVGNLHFSYWANAQFGNRYFRLVNHRDGICKLPPKKWDFSHAGSPINLLENGQIDSSGNDWQQFMEDLDQSWSSFLDTAFDTHKQHKMQAYISKIAQNIGV